MQLTSPARSLLPPVPSHSLRRDPSTWLAWIDEAFRSARPRSWHSRGVWHRIAAGHRHELAHLPHPRLQILELAALLHDVGRAIDPLDLEPHAFVGARFLDSIGLTDVAPLVAHHAGAKMEASSRGMTHLDRWPEVDGELLVLLDYADHTVDMQGESVSLRERRADIVSRHGEQSPNVDRFDRMLPEMLRVERLFAHRGLLATSR